MCFCSRLYLLHTHAHTHTRGRKRQSPPIPCNLFVPTIMWPLLSFNIPVTLQHKGSWIAPQRRASDLTNWLAFLRFSECVCVWGWVWVFIRADLWSGWTTSDYVRDTVEGWVKMQLSLFWYRLNKQGNKAFLHIFSEKFLCTVSKLWHEVGLNIGLHVLKNSHTEPPIIWCKQGIWREILKVFQSLNNYLLAAFTHREISITTVICSYKEVIRLKYAKLKKSVASPVWG